ncbi:MAG: HNH endonuclease [Methanobrevibacter sp.]|jgi:hypothetical protein|nr:HNH endonuclease [Candidatus Methanoflexus mossambicus]
MDNKSDSTNKIENYETSTIKKHIEDIIDYAAPKMDVYEFAIYMYLLRNTRLIGKVKDFFAFRSKRKELPMGASSKKTPTPMSKKSAYDRLISLESKNFIQILDNTYKGKCIQVYYPSEIQGLIKEIENDKKVIDIEEIDFFESHEYKEKILERENRKCFYCFKKLSNEGYVIEHVVSRPEGNNSYRNLVASCRTCNNKKSNLDVNDFIRKLYRENIISDTELTALTQKLEQLKNGELKPDL